MKIFLDTLDLNQIKKYSNMGILSGVTTNPTLAKRHGMLDDIDMIKKIREVMPMEEGGRGRGENATGVHE